MRFDIFFLLLMMAIIAVIDYKQHIIPDELIIGIIAFKVLYSIFMNTLYELLISICYSLQLTTPLLLLTVYMEKKTSEINIGCDILFD